MSRNSRRTSANPPTPQAPAPPRGLPPQTATNPFGIDLVAATEVVKLPSGGKFYGTDSSLHGVSEIEIRHMTAREEDILSNQEFVFNGTVFDRVLSSVIIDGSISPLDMIDGDRNALLYAARITGYGNDYTIMMDCDKCGKNAEFTFDLEKRTVIHDLPSGVTLDDSTGYFNFELPKTKATVIVKILTGADEAFLRKQNEKAESLGLENNKTLNLFRRSIVSVNGVTDQGQIAKLFDILPAIDSRKIRMTINNLSPTVSTKQEVACGSCGEESESEVPFSLGFFWPDL